jgi:hypothetical protein
VKWVGLGRRDELGRALKEAGKDVEAQFSHRIAEGLDGSSGRSLARNLRSL